MIKANTQTAAIILSGGAGSRINGYDKGLQLYRGQPLIKHVINAVVPQVDEIHICANRNIQTYKSHGYPVHKDEHSSYQGPMAGISAALKAAIIVSPSLGQILVLSCDVPHLPTDLRDKLELALYEGDGRSDVAVAHDGNRRQNLHCLIRRKAWGSLIDFFDQGGRAMHRWFTQVDTQEVTFTGPDQETKNYFDNINTAEQLK